MYPGEETIGLYCRLDRGYLGTQPPYLSMRRICRRKVLQTSRRFEELPFIVSSKNRVKVI